MERLTPLSAGFLQVEDEDPTATLAIASIAVFEGPPPSHEEFVTHVAGRLPLVPRFRQRVRQVPLDLAAPVWVDDPDVDVGWHVRRTALPSPGGLDELHDVVARVMSQRMDRNRPLWEYWVVEGMPDDQWAVIQKAHHCVVDGVSGTELYRLVFDETPDPRPPVPDEWVPQPSPSELGLLGEAARDLALSPVLGVRAAGSLLSSPRSLVRLVVQTARGALAFGAALLPVASTSLSGPMGRQRRYTTATVTMDEVRLIRQALAVTVNDVALAAVSGGFRSLLLSRGEEPHEHAVRTMVPVSVRRPGQESIQDNQITVMLPYLPVDIADPVERLLAVRRRVAEAGASGEPEAGHSLTATAAYEPFLPVALGVRLVFHLPQRQVVTVTTNVPGPRQPVYALGRRCLSITPYVPIADRMRIGIAIFSYCHDLAFGITGDYDTASDVAVLAEGISESVAELVDAARHAGSQ